MPTIIRRPNTTVDPFDRIVQRFFGQEWPGFSESLEEGTLALDVSEDESSVIVRASLPGFAREDVHIELHDGVLTIKAQHTEESEESGERYFRRERRVGSLSRRVALPGVIGEDGADAKLADGVLEVRVPKARKESPRKISVN